MCKKKDYVEAAAKRWRGVPAALVAQDIMRHLEYLEIDYTPKERLRAMEEDAEGVEECQRLPVLQELCRLPYGELEWDRDMMAKALIAQIADDCWQ
jgi:hypothetical protein